MDAIEAARIAQITPAEAEELGRKAQVAFEDKLVYDPRGVAGYGFKAPDLATEVLRVLHGQNLGFNDLERRRNLIARDKQEHADRWQALQAEAQRLAFEAQEANLRSIHLTPQGPPTPTIPPHIIAILAQSEDLPDILDSERDAIRQLDAAIANTVSSVNGDLNTLPETLARLRDAVTRRTIYADRLKSLHDASGRAHEPLDGEYDVRALETLLGALEAQIAFLRVPWSHVSREQAIREAQITLDSTEKEIDQIETTPANLVTLHYRDPLLARWSRALARKDELTRQLETLTAHREQARTVAAQAAQQALQGLGGFETLVTAIAQALALQEPPGPAPELAELERTITDLDHKIRRLDDGPFKTALETKRQAADAEHTRRCGNRKAQRRQRARELVQAFLEPRESARAQIVSLVHAFPDAFPADTDSALVSCMHPQVFLSTVRALLDSCKTTHEPEAPERKTNRAKHPR